MDPYKGRGRNELEHSMRVISWESYAIFNFFLRILVQDFLTFSKHVVENVFKHFTPQISINLTSSLIENLLFHNLQFSDFYLF